MISEDLIYSMLCAMVYNCKCQINGTVAYFFSLAHQPHSRNNLVKKIKVQTISFICLTLDGKQ